MSSMNHQIIKDFGLVHYIVKVRLGGYSGIRKAFAGVPCSPPSKSVITSWKASDTLPAWTIQRLCEAAEVDPIELLQLMERRELIKRAGAEADAIPSTVFDWTPSPLTRVKEDGLFAALVPDVRGKMTELHRLMADVRLPYSAISKWKLLDSIPIWALLRVCRWAKANPVDVLRIYEEREVEKRTKQQ